MILGLSVVFGLSSELALLEKRCENSDFKACFKAGEFYDFGLENTKKDQKRAINFYKNPA